MAEQKEREALFGIAVGKKGVGKTYCTLQLVQSYLKGDPANGIPPRKVLFLDVNNEYGNVKGDQNPEFAHIKAISLNDIRRFTYHPKIEARRVSVMKEGGGKMTLNEVAEALQVILENYMNGLLIIEDINKFVSDSMPNDLIGSIVTQRHLSVDIITHYQTIGKIAHPKIWGNCNWIRLHKCEDTVERHKAKFAGDTIHLEILEKMVDMEFKKGNIRFCAYLDKDDGKIKGGFTLQQFRDAIEAYLQENYKIVKREYEKVVLKTGKKLHVSQASAVDFLMKDYINNYYGNQN